MLIPTPHYIAAGGLSITAEDDGYFVGYDSDGTLGSMSGDPTFNGGTLDFIYSIPSAGTSEVQFSPDASPSPTSVTLNGTTYDLDDFGAGNYRFIGGAQYIFDGVTYTVEFS